MRKWFLIAAVGIALTVTACASGSETTPSESSTGNGIASVSVPDSYTAVVIQALSDPTFPFRGTDGKYHVAYDLELQNASGIPATVEKVEVVDTADPDRVITSYTGDQLVDPDCAYGDCNRLRSIVAAHPVANAKIPSQEGRILFVDFAFDSLQDAPAAVQHRFHGLAAAGPAAQEPTKVDYRVTPFDISAGTPRVIAPPVRGDRWVALNGCCLPGFPHRTSLNALTGAIRNSQRFAIDWKRMDAEGRFFEGDKTKNESYVDYGEPILAVADGTVVSTLDGQPANAPGILPAQDPELAPNLTVENVDGNHIVLDLGDGVYAMYAHFIKGSLKVKVGDTVNQGDQIGELGNTGNANASHLHFQLMNGPSLVNSDGLPYEIDSFDHAGQVAPKLLLNADDFLSGSFASDSPVQPEPRTDELPLNLAIVDFPN
jgi:murein DD-endopeptidase MepM/ murein hydrolase activator NlpD